MIRVPLGVTLPPVPSEPITVNYVASLGWLSWFRAVWQRVNEPWKFHPSYGGVATLVAGTVTIASSVIKAGHRVTFSAQTNTGTPGHLSLGTIVPASTSGTTITPGSFIINSTSATDTRTVFWQIWESH